MYEGYAGLIFDMDGTILDTEPTHRQAWNEVLGRYGMRFDEQAMVALNGSPTANRPAIIELNQPISIHIAAQEKPAVKAMLLDSVRPLPLIEVVKAWHGRRPMSVGTGSESAVAEALLAHRAASLLLRGGGGRSWSTINPRPIPSCCAPSAWASRRKNASSSKMPTLVCRRRSAREWTQLTCVCCERRAVTHLAVCQ